jgi:hypothetical protein
MNKQEFLKLFELEEIYKKYQNKIPFSFGLHDRLIGTDTFIFFGFHSQNAIKICIECVEFSEKIQELELHLIINNNEQIQINIEENFKNEVFSFLTFDTNLDAALKFIADFINKILKPKYQLMGGVSVH